MLKLYRTQIELEDVAKKITEGAFGFNEEQRKRTRTALTEEYGRLSLQKWLLLKSCFEDTQCSGEDSKFIFRQMADVVRDIPEQKTANDKTIFEETATMLSSVAATSPSEEIRNSARGSLASILNYEVYREYNSTKLMTEKVDLNPAVSNMLDCINNDIGGESAWAPLTVCAQIMNDVSQKNHSKVQSMLEIVGDGSVYVFNEGFIDANIDVQTTRKGVLKALLDRPVV